MEVDHQPARIHTLRHRHHACRLAGLQVIPANTLVHGVTEYWHPTGDGASAPQG